MGDRRFRREAENPRSCSLLLGCDCRHGAAPSPMAARSPISRALIGRSRYVRPQTPTLSPGPSPTTSVSSARCVRREHRTSRSVGAPSRRDRGATARLPEPLGERGGALSGGQQQRLCIARACRQSASTHSDETDERARPAVRGAHTSTLSDLRRHMTVVVIAHRLSTLDICNRIMVIQDGDLRRSTRQRISSTNAFFQKARRFPAALGNWTVRPPAELCLRRSIDDRKRCMIREAPFRSTSK